MTDYYQSKADGEHETTKTWRETLWDNDEHFLKSFNQLHHKCNNSFRMLATSKQKIKEESLERREVSQSLYLFNQNHHTLCKANKPLDSYKPIATVLNESF